MKQTPLILSIIALVASVVFGILSLTSNGTHKKVSPVVSGDSAAVAGSIVFFNIDEVMDGYDMANDLRSVVENKIQGIQNEIDRRGNKLQKDINTFQDKINKGLLLPSVAESQQKKLQQQQADYQNFVIKKQNEMAEEQQVMMNQILDAIKTYVDEYNIDRQYSMILATQGAVLPAPVVVGDDILDITSDILAGLNDEYVKSKSNGEVAEEAPAEE
ncbi:MAG: OmpH family outer membrane protein [Bacteroidales bacterium]|nr:OmpH family outer membrane protein [Bacteroidales bacterium]